MPDAANDHDLNDEVSEVSHAPDTTDILLMYDMPHGYDVLLRELKERIQTAQIKATLAVNRELVLLYWSIGRDILARQQQEGWGAKVIERLSADLRRAFPKMKGLSRTNLLYMRAFAEAWSEETIVQQLVGQIPWGHNVRLIDRVDDPVERQWYAQATIQNGWSRNILEMQIETNLYARQGQAQTNFERTLPKPQSDLAQQLLKDPYIFDFTGLSEEAQEREVERALVQHVRNFLLELGVGFAFVGSQYPLEVEGEDFFLDLLFYHFKLHCFVVIELKTTDFKPEYAGKMQFYLSAVDAQVKHDMDAPSIGLILCRTKKRLIVEYTLRESNRPIGISEYRLSAALPDAFKGSLPTVEQLEAELGDTSGKKSDASQ